MLNKRLLAGIAGVMALGLAVPAMAEDPPPSQEEVPTATVTSTITVAPTASIWATDTEILLELVGFGEENYALEESSLRHLNNTAADISVAIENGGGATNLPADLNYWLFRGNESTAITAIQADAPTDFDTGVFRFSGTQVNTGVGTTLFANVAISEADMTNGVLLPVVYAADARESLPPVASHVTVVTWTIAANP